VKATFLAVLLAAAAASAPAFAHPCDGDARERAAALLRFHFEEPGVEVGIADKVQQLPALKALAGSGRFDVLEVWGYIYRAEYRMRFIYAQIPGSCVLMGQEILEASDPY
jgi:hypothetical protein